MARWRASRAACLCVLATLAALLPSVAAQSTCRVQLVGTGARLTGSTATASAVESGSVRCTGSAVALTGPIALRGVVTFAGEVESPSDVSAGQPVAVLVGSKTHLLRLLTSPYVLYGTAQEPRSPQIRQQQAC